MNPAASKYGVLEDRMGYWPTAIARKLVEVANEDDRSLTPLELMKLTYLSHGWNLAFTGQPLIEEDVQAWQYGPVYPSLYHAVKHFRASPVSDVPAAGAEVFGVQKVDSQAEKLIRAVFNAYKKFNGVQLSALTHQPGTPWQKTWDGSKNNVIPDSQIKQHFDELKKRQTN